MNVFEIIGGILLMLTAIFIIIVVTLQESKGSIAALGGSSMDSYFGKNQGRTMEAMLKRVTKIAGIVFFVLSIAVYALGVYLK